MFSILIFCVIIIFTERFSAYLVTGDAIMSDTQTEIIDGANAVKTDFDNIYNRRDPRAYFGELRACEYQIPQNAKPTFLRVFENLRRLRRRPGLSVVDVGCSYGINAALLRYGFTLDDLYRRYADPDITLMSADALRRADLTFFSSRPTSPTLYFTGLDSAQRAVEYAEDVRLLDRAVTANLETRTLEPSQAAALARSDIVISTGAVGYVTEQTFTQVVQASHASSPPWVASFVLRMFPYTSMAEALAAEGMATFKLGGQTFIQRRFSDSDEQAGVLAQLEERGLQVAGLERNGYLHAEFFLSMPEPDAGSMGLRVPWEVVAAP